MSNANFDTCNFDNFASDNSNFFSERYTKYKPNDVQISSACHVYPHSSRLSASTY